MKIDRWEKISSLLGYCYVATIGLIMLSALVWVASEAWTSFREAFL